jgi:N-acetylglutamate synthase-like GNAT family acetyltransferase
MSLPLFVLRPATAVDEPIIRALIREGRINPFGLHWPKFIVAVDAQNDTVIGCGQLKRINDEVYELASLAVTAVWRRRGVAQAIIHALQEKHQAQHPHLPLWLMCESRLVPFYTQYDFVELHDYTQMPRHFARYKRLVSGMMWLFRQRGYLAVMRWSN